MEGRPGEAAAHGHKLVIVAAARRGCGRLAAVPRTLDLLRQLTDDALEVFLGVWRTAPLPKAAWTHAAHVAVCAAEAWPAVPIDALGARMKAGIPAGNAAVGTANSPTSGHHETLTWFWYERGLAHQAAHLEPGRLAAVRSAVAACGEAWNP